MKKLSGCITALVTPLSRDGKHVNLKRLTELIEYNLNNGVSGIVVLGTTGAPTTLSTQEKIDIVKHTLKVVGGRVPVLAGAGHNSTQQAIENSVLFENLGVDGLLHVTPFYSKCTQNGLIKHFSTIAQSVKIPIILYNVPERTGVNMMPETVAKLSKISNITGLKEANSNIEQAIEIMRLVDDDFTLLSGNDALTLPMLSIGAKGVISVASNVVPKQMNEICASFSVGDLAWAKAVQLKLNPLIRTLFLEVNPIPVRTALNLIGKHTGLSRLPMTEMEKPNKLKLKTELVKLNLIK